MTGDASSHSDDTRRASSHHGWALVGIFWIMALSVLTIAQGLIVPIVTAMMLALIFSPVRRAMDRVGFSSGVSVTS